MLTSEKLYITQEDLYRVGNSESPQLTKIRPGEVTLKDINGIIMIISDGKGISLYNRKGLDKSELSGWVYEIKSGTALPPDLYLKKDDNKEGHYFVCPVKNMPAKHYVGELEKIAVFCEKYFKKQKAN